MANLVMDSLYGMSTPPWITATFRGKDSSVLCCNRICLFRSERQSQKWSTFRTTSARGKMYNLLSVMMISILLVSSVVDAEPSDGCDWTGSGLENPSEDRGVQPVYLRCSQGSVTWLYPRGALRVVLRYGTAGKEFQGCLKLSPDFLGANIYVERHRHLKLLHSGSSLDSRAGEKLHCFQSRHGQVALFLEADASSRDPLRRESASFEYDLQLMYSSNEPDPWEECRPCSAKETLDMFCSSDFVARGTISSIYNDDQLDRTLLTVRASRVIRQVSTVFNPKPGHSIETRSPKLVKAPSKWKGMDGVEEDLTDNHVEHVGTLHVPLKCQAKHGGGEFIFMGRQRLGDAVLWCAPRLEEWVELMHQAQRDGTAQCRLES